jgi:hypothetical protein
LLSSFNHKVDRHQQKPRWHCFTAAPGEVQAPPDTATILPGRAGKIIILIRLDKGDTG